MLMWKWEVKINLDDVVSEGPVELNIRQEPGVVAGGEARLHDPLPVAEDVKLRQCDVRGHLDWLIPVFPTEFKVWGSSQE